MPSDPHRYQWQSDPNEGFTQIKVQQRPLVNRGDRGLMSVRARAVRDREGWVALPFVGQVTVGGNSLSMVQSLVATDVLRTELVILPGASSVPILVEWSTSARPSMACGMEHADLPASANGGFGHPALASLGPNQRPWQRPGFVGSPLQNSEPITVHFREPLLSDPGTLETKMLLLAPVVDVWHPGVPQRVALFASPEYGWKVERFGTQRNEGGWSFATIVEPGTGVESRSVFLSVHEGGPEVAWEQLHLLAHKQDMAPPAWLKEVRVSHQDFLGPGIDGRRGSAYDVDALHFRRFGVGFSTQHGYYPYWGDFIHPERKEWVAMASDGKGSCPMSLEKIRDRIALCRAQGTRAGIYLHMAALDPASPIFERLKHAVAIKESGEPVTYSGWNGPDLYQMARHMSMARKEWQDHLLQQAAWIMELLAPDAIVVDETFAGCGYDWAGGRPVATSPGAVQFLKDLRNLVRSYRPDAAVLTSDCGLAGFAFWADGEGGDHAYPGLLAEPWYREAPTRYRSVLGSKPWLPTAWQFQRFWTEQLELARNTGAAVGVGNGWIEYTGLANLPPEVASKMLTDLDRLKDVGNEP